jgi:transposase
VITGSRDQWHHLGWKAVSASAPHFVWCRSCGGISARPLTQDFRQNHPHLGWLAYSPGERAEATFGSSGAAKRLHLEQLPGYAPDLNPDEGIWNYLKRVELGNVCCTNLDHLSTALIRARERLRHKREIVQSCSWQCGYRV